MNLIKLLFSGRIHLRRRWIFVMLMMSMLRPSLAYDNSTFPAFDADKLGRGLNWVSIHPDGERWLISECLLLADDGRLGCHLYLYNLRTRLYQQYQLSPDYSYTDAQFSPDGSLIVAIRRPVPRSDAYQETVRVLSASEIFTMKPDGTEFRIHAVPKGYLKMPNLSADATRIIYWESAKTRPSAAKTLFADFDVHEHDLSTGKTEIFAGPFRFFLASKLQYLNQDQVVVTAYGPAHYAADIGSYRERFNSSEIYLLTRGQQVVPDPSYTEIQHAADLAMDRNQTIYLLGTHPKHGISIFRLNRDPAHWRIPRLVPGGISTLIAAPGGQYIGFVYPVSSAWSGIPSSSLGILNLSDGRWIPLSLPPPASAKPIPTR